MKYPDRLGAREPFPRDRRTDGRIVAAMNHRHARTLEEIIADAWSQGVNRYTWHATLGRLNSLQRRGVVVCVGPKRWRRTWLVQKDDWNG